MEHWDVHRPPRAEGKTFLVTGGNAGIGYFVAEQLAGTGATVLLGSRDAGKADVAMASIRSRVPDAKLGHLRLDLSELASIQSTVDTLGFDRLDAVVCNAGVLLENQPRRETAEGHELTFATNHLGHFVLVDQLMPLLEAARAGRVVTTGSFVGKSAQLDLDDLQSERDYQPKRTYARSKQAQMLFAFELDRRLRAAGSTVLSVVDHPGGALDSLTPPRPVHPALGGRKFPAGLLLQGKDAGAWPAVRAVLDPDARGGEMFGPRVFGLRGEPRREPVRGRLADTGLAARLWAASVGLTGAEVTR
ncbi:SDR family NAD(P)-dependent oxidoreductase [Amycolatopsis regifaucium]|uniref:Short-chain dehydrogenase n=1 Tax=Amycolatopsis regifaucium TaxID=546365 RepID=A0A154MX40_9PSEU|nr:SDR family NAD(P)-dependent oxidoreductase [Amycolatopsis regifaucium]KZB88580.1 short-chain dehydrogenase [Amycolatopsis regifaucium]OKA07250.1 short-chain dehydrogenase [Amycolatopsis regifaucium]SFI52079.1 NAD(P)-dependent dehydrogenase, short-chain alcohol dehydrogenase family [Amycolatopsis regifaucium]